MLARRKRRQCQCMNRVLHLAGKSLIDHAMTGHEAFALKLWRDHGYLKVPPTGCRTCVSGMQRTFVFDHDFGCTKRLTKCHCDSLRRVHFFPRAEGKAGARRSWSALTPSRTSAPKKPNISS